MLNNAQVRQLKSAAHHLHPIVMIGAKGLTDAVDKEITLALNVHELIKIKLGNLDDASQQTMIDHITQIHQAYFIQKIGHIAVFFKQKAENSNFKLHSN